MGKSKRTPENEKIILDAIRTGLSYKSASAIVGMTYETFRVWRDEVPAFSVAIQREEEFGKLERLKRISRHAAEDWRADAWILSHRHPEEFSEKRIIETRGDQRSPAEKFMEALDDKDEAETETE